MPEIVTKGVGLLTRKMLVFNPAAEPEAFRPGGDLYEQLATFQTADGVRDANAVYMRRVVAEACAAMDPAEFCRNAPCQVEDVRGDMAQHPQAFVAGYYGEDSAVAIMSEWLVWYDRLAAERAKPDPDIPRALEIAEELGRLRELLRWRAGVDPDTGARREALALQARSNRLALAGDRDGGRVSANSKRHEKADLWRKVAREVAAASPVGGRRLETRILEELTRRGFPARSGPAIRKAIKGIRR